LDAISLSERLLKALRAQIDTRSQALTYGSVKDWESYQRVVGEVTGLTSAEQLVLDLLKKMETVDDD